MTSGVSRLLRLELSGGIYHVTSRGEQREDIYAGDADRGKGVTLTWTPRFAKQSFDDDKKVTIAAIHPDFERSLSLCP